jgi:hypothetical protein
METITHTSVKWVYTKEFGNKLIPIVYFDGQITFTANQWIHSLIEQGFGASKLERYIRALTHFFSFYNALLISTQQEPEYRNLFAMFIDAKKYGTDSYCSSTSHPYLENLFLNWHPSDISNIKSNYLNLLNDFDKWQSIYHGAERLNPSEERFLTAYEQYQEFKTKEKWDPFLHLSPSGSKTKEVSKVSLQQHRRFNKTQARVSKTFPPDRFIELIESLKNPRDKLYCLILGAGSLRGSEPLHLFHDDFIGKDEYGQLKIRIADPEVGEYVWEDKNGKVITGTRATYIVQNFNNEHLGEYSPLRNLMPRTAYINRDSRQSAGFKGMTFTEEPDDNGEHFLFWCDPLLGRYAYKVYEEYRDTYINTNIVTGKPHPKGWPHHPWFFINIDKAGYGLPFTVSASKKMWDRAKERIGIKGYRLGRHSLRHLFGFYCANAIGLQPHEVQTYMHHSSADSTNVYYHLSNKDVRQKLIDAFDGNPTALAVSQIAKNFRYKIPRSWA